MAAAAVVEMMFPRPLMTTRQSQRRRLTVECKPIGRHRCLLLVLQGCFYHHPHASFPRLRQTIDQSIKQS